MKCLVVIDMVNGFVKEGALADKKIMRIVPNILMLVKEAIEKNIPIIVFRDCHSLDDYEFRKYPVHCLKGSYESQIIDELKPYEKHFHIIEKNTTNGYNVTKFQRFIRINNPSEVIVTGCCTDICVEDFVLSYLNDIHQNNLKTKIIVIKNAVDTFDLQEHNAKIANAQALKRMEASGAIINSISFNNESRLQPSYNNRKKEYERV